MQIISELKKAPLVWLLAPILLLFIALQVAFISPCKLTVVFPVVLVTGVLSCVRFRQKGFYLSLVFLCALGFLIYRQDATLYLWQWGILSSFAISFYLFSFASQDLSQLLASYRGKDQEHLAEITALNQDCKAQMDQFCRERTIYEEKIEDLEKSRVQLETKCAREQELTKLFREQIELFEEQKEGLILDAFEAKKAASMHGEGGAYDPELSGLYRQLRKQFVQKREILDQTRIELFTTQTRLYQLEQEKEYSALEDQYAHVRALENDYIALSEDYDRLNQELTSLEELIPSSK